MSGETVKRTATRLLEFKGSSKINPRSDMDSLSLEILEKIIIDSIIEELTEKRAATASWEILARRRIDVLGTVCLKWNSLLHSNTFQSELRRQLDRLEHIPVFCVDTIASKSITNDDVFGVAKLNNKLYLARSGYIEVYTCEKNFKFEKHTSFPQFRNILCMVSCHNSLYLTDRESIWKITVEETELTSKPLIVNDELCLYARNLFVSKDGDLMVFNIGDACTFLLVYGADGSEIRRTPLPIFIANVLSVAQRPNGNLIICQDRLGIVVLTEISLESTIIRTIRETVLSTYQDHDLEYMIHLDSFGRLIVVTKHDKLMQLCSPVMFDSELNFSASTPISCRTKNGRICFDMETNHLIVAASTRITEFCFTDTGLSQDKDNKNGGGRDVDDDDNNNDDEDSSDADNSDDEDSSNADDDNTEDDNNDDEDSSNDDDD